ncbi:MoxR-like ATPase in aerotolerance operon [hydrothermal vent metagenome]|uniref:MoxR-like ATPase in aerotolerance operon n=1 Tax=hydrothermal vent metagenome TaxID=652676 RepID=A0A1W1BPI2_9ZZZZ
MEKLQILLNYLNTRIVGQQQLTQQMIISLLANGHLLVEGPPGLAKTTAIKALCEGLEADFHRVQFTPDLLPSDLTGTEIYKAQQEIFEFQKGPLFHNLLLADEINRAPAKVQSALLEAMGEGQITVAKETYQLPELFLVMATQNPIEQEGTYPLPEAQLDRFLLHVEIDYPNVDAEREILKISRDEAKSNMDKYQIESKLSQQELFELRAQVANVFIADDVEEYILRLVDATRNPQKYDEQLAKSIEFGVSPRATIALERCSKAYAFLQNRDYLTPEDVREMIFDVFRHRLILTFEAETKGETKNSIIEKLLEIVPSV